jgi:diketogulonate reductase-like aldo/keto reductase
MLKRIIPSSGEALPVIGLGTWQTFDVADGSAKQNLVSVLNHYHNGGATLIDSSPMYGHAEEVIGELTSRLPFANDLFYATKVWTTGHTEGIRQMEASMSKMKRSTMDLIQVHNLVDWKTHLPQLRQWKESGKVRYTGITHYTDSHHEELEKLMRSEKPDFVQFNYSITSRSAEKRLLSAAADLGIATLINRPLGEGRLMQQVKGKPLPAWAADWDIGNWSVFLLKYILAHEAVTCVIPATGNPQHAIDNLAAGTGRLPDIATKMKMIAYLDKL